jgi:hypothetical protein
MFCKNLLPPSSAQADIASLSLISTSNCVSVRHLSSLFQRTSKIYIYGSRGCICVCSISTRPQYCKMHFYMNISFFQTYPILLFFIYVKSCTLVPFIVRSSRFVWWHFKKCLNSIKLKKKKEEKMADENMVATCPSDWWCLTNYFRWNSVISTMVLRIDTRVMKEGSLCTQDAQEK